MSTIVVEEVGIGTPDIITGHNLNQILEGASVQLGAQHLVHTECGEDVDISDEPVSSDVDMLQPVIVMDAEESSVSKECYMAESMNQEDSNSIQYLPLANCPNPLYEQQPIENVPIESAPEPGILELPDEFSAQTVVELSRLSWGTRDPQYLRGCYWSPDGTCILAPVNKDGMHVIELPSDLYAVDEVNARRPLDLLSSAVHVPENGTVYDCCWYPFMNSAAPESCCWISTQQHGPIQMWDAFNGTLRCSYRGYDAVDEVEAALCVAFSIDGTSVIGGYRKSVKIFCTGTPGRDFTSFALKSPASCLAVHHTHETVLAIGSWNGTVSLHDVRSPKLEVVDQFARPKAGGVTMVKFGVDGKHLFVGSRKDDVLSCWDVRRSDRPLFAVRRTVRTNQRVQFDVSSSGRWLASGDTDGLVRVWELNGMDAGKGLSEYQFPLHHDCCNGVSIHPSRPILATVSGQHHFDDSESGEAVQVPALKENSLILWWYGKSRASSE